MAIDWDLIYSYYEKRPSIEEVEQSNHYRANSPTLKPLGKSCHDCAITTDFYTPMAEALKLLPKSRQIHHTDRWFCHNNCNRACRGAKDYLGLIPTPKAL